MCFELKVRVPVIIIIHYIINCMHLIMITAYALENNTTSKRMDCRKYNGLKIYNKNSYDFSHIWTVIQFHFTIQI